MQMGTQALKQAIVCGVIVGMVASAMSCSRKKTGDAVSNGAGGSSSSGSSSASAVAGNVARDSSVGAGASANHAGVPSKTWDGKGIAPGGATFAGAGGGGIGGAAVNGGDMKVPNTGTVAQNEPEGPSCFTVTYTHKKMMSHSSEETCSHHKNVFKLPHDKVNPKSICVRLNGTPVRFSMNKKAPSEIMLAAIAGPDAKITARYCVGKNTCNEECVIPRDSFMDAIGGTEDMANTQIGQWSAEADEAEAKHTAKLNADLKKELADLDESAPGTSEGLSIFKDWVGEPEAPACGSKHAKAGL
jgi:hypothetical protein